MAQAFWFLLYQIGGFPLLVLWKGAILAAMCGIAGYLAAWRSGNLYVGLAAALVGVPLVKLFAADRPALVSFLLVAVYVLMLEKYVAGSRRWVWPLIPLQWIWANSHGGFFLGLVVLGCYVVGTRKTASQLSEDSSHKTLWIVAAACVVVSILNPNGLRIFEVLANYRQSYLTSMLIEWQRPPLWGPPYTFNILLYLAAGAILLNIKRVRLTDALLLVAFGAASLLAFRNVILIAFLAPVLIAAYGWPMIKERMPQLPAYAPAAGSAAVLALLLIFAIANGQFFQLRAAEWKFPVEAARFIESKGIKARMFNSYEYGGYLLWSLWPQQKTFIDGRALNESVYRDYQQVLYLGGQDTQQSREKHLQLLDEYGAEIAVMNGFEYVTGVIYPLVLALADPQNRDWRLVFEDTQAVVFARNSTNGTLQSLETLNKLRVLDHLAASCRTYIEHDPELPNCARSLGFLFLRGGDHNRAREALALYLSNISYRDADAEEAFRKAGGG